MAGQTNKAGSSDGTLTLDKVFVAVPAADSKAQASMIMLESRAQPNSSRNVRTAVRLRKSNYAMAGREKRSFWIIYCS
jgi:hypothetical protein